MQYSKLTVAGCAALMFGLLACSGEDGRDGINGVNGLNGADGTSCSVKSLGDASGYKILCGGDSVGVLLNGKTGATGKQGVAGPQGKDGAVGKTGAQGEKGDKGDGCSVAALSDNSGYDVFCGANKVGTIKNGTNGKDGQSCTTQAADDGIVISCDGQITKILNGTNGKDGKDGTNCSAETVKDESGRNGIKMWCDGKEISTVWDGKDGTASESCTTTDKGDGTYEVKCGTADPMTMYKAVCGVDPYDPDKKFCVLGKTYELCDGKTYKVNREYCDNGKVVELCGEYKKLRNDHYEFVKYRAVADGEFCLNGIITPKCGGKEFGVLEFCDTTKVSDGKPVTIVSYKQCPNTSLSIDEMMSELKGAYSELGLTAAEFENMISSESEEIEEDVEKMPNVLKDWMSGVGSPLAAYHVENIEAFYTALEGVQTTCLSDGNVALEKCGTTKYDPTKQFCDIRDNRVYKFETIDGLAWMTENLAFEYKLPKVDVEKDEDGVIIKSSIVQIMGSVVYEDKVYENFEVNGVRYYTWKSAKGAWDPSTAVGDIRAILGDAALEKLDPEDRVVGACPDGWRLPTQGEIENLNDLGTSANNEKGYETLPNGDKKVNFNVNFVGLYDVSSNKVVNFDKAAYFWSSSEDDEVDNQAYGLEITSMTKSKVNSTTKTYGFTIRCVKAAN